MTLRKHLITRDNTAIENVNDRIENVNKETETVNIKLKVRKLLNTVDVENNDDESERTVP